MGIWIELGVFALALAFGLWQIHDVKQAQKKTARERAQAKASGGPGQASGPTGSRPPADADPVRPDREAAEGASRRPGAGGPGT